MTELTYLVGTDIGTLGTKTVVVDAEGHIKGSSFLEYGVITPKQGWAEQWPDVWEKAAQASIKAAIEKAKIDPKEIAGAAISSLYGGSGIPLDKEMKPIRPCIIWADRRATDECKWLRDNIGADALFKVTGNVIDPYYGYTKMLWIKNQGTRQLAEDSPIRDSERLRHQGPHRRGERRLQQRRQLRRPLRHPQA